MKSLPNSSNPIRDGHLSIFLIVQVQLLLYPVGDYEETTAHPLIHKGANHLPLKY